MPLTILCYWEERDRERCDDFSSEMQALQRRREQSLPFMLDSAQNFLLSFMAGIQPVLEQRPLGMDGAREKI